MNSLKLVLIALMGLNLASFALAKEGADRQVGWIIRKTKNGIVKIPKRQIFQFEGSDVTGEFDKPFETSFGERKTPKRRSLIPVRKSFRKDMLDSVGLSSQTESNQ